MIFSVKKAKQGKGLFAAEPIKAGTVLFAARGKKIPYAVVARKRNPDNALQIGKNTYLDFQPPGVYANHSCKPNTGFTDDTILVAIRDIRIGEEITYDYSTTMDKLTVCEFICGCDNRTCRGEIAGFKTLPKGLQSFYKRLGIVQEFLLKEK